MHPSIPPPLGHSFLNEIHLYYRLYDDPTRRRYHSVDCPRCGGNADTSLVQLINPFGMKMEYVWGPKLGRPSKTAWVRSQAYDEAKSRADRRARIVRKGEAPWLKLGVSRRTYYRATTGR